jgi:hemoglobin
MQIPVAPTVTSAPAANPHFARIGGADAIAYLVERFYLHMDTRPEAAAIRALHPADLAPVKAVLVRFLCEWMGGPQDYSAERGHPRLRRKHLGFPIGASERDAWLLCMRLALRDTVPDAELAGELEHAFFKTADFIRNDRDHHHDHHRQHRIRPA